MTWDPATNSGKLLWQMMPAVYRDLDGTYGKDPKRPHKPLRQRGDLANYLDAYGVLLDQIKNTILQRLHDTSPDTCQEWLIPYFADLLDVHLVSPDIEGQRLEVARAISWRQRKGTIGCTKEIASVVGRYEKTVPILDSETGVVNNKSLPTVVVQEGFRRVATTARIGLPLPSLNSLGLESEAFDVSEPPSPIRDAIRPGLAAGTIDFRYLSRAIEVPKKTRASQVNAFGGTGNHWQQLYPRGMPCKPNTYQDVSVRTVDVRRPNWQHGHYHPHSTLLYSAPREGFFAANRFELSWDEELWPWFKLFDETDEDTVPFIEREENKVLLFERILPPLDYGNEKIYFIERRRNSMQGPRQRIVGVELSEEGTELFHRREQVDTTTFLLRTGFELIEEEIEQAEERLTLCGFGEETPGIDAMTINLTTVFDAKHFVLEYLVSKAKLYIQQAWVQVLRCALLVLNVSSPPIPKDVTTVPKEKRVLSVTDSLIQDLHLTGWGGCRLEYCTILGGLDCKNLEASDSILIDTIDPDTFNQIYIRFSALPGLENKPLDPDKGRIYLESITREDPILLSNSFGEPGSGVLHPASDISIRQGAEDGGELGCYHHRHYVLREQAVVDKLKEFLPVTQCPVLIVHRDWNSPVPMAETTIE